MRSRVGLSVLLAVGLASAAPAQDGGGQAPAAERSTQPDPPARWTLKLLKAPFQKPWWAALAPREPDAGRDQVMGYTRARYAEDDEGVCEMIRLVHHKLDEDSADQWAPRFWFRLGALYEWRGFLAEAFHFYALVSQLPATTRCKLEPNFPKTFAHLQQAAAIGIARVCAHAKLRRNAQLFLKQLKLDEPYLLSLTGRVYDLIGANKESDSAYKVAVSRARNPPDGFGPTHPINIRLNAVQAAAKHQNHDQARQLGEPYLKRDRESFRWPQEKAVHDNIRGILEAIDGKTRVNLRAVPDGTYEGTGDGWDKPITMSVTVAKKKITQILVVKHEEMRAFNAFTVVPERIVAKQATRVDGVPEATATAFGIMTAVERALAGAVGRRR